MPQPPEHLLVPGSDQDSNDREKEEDYIHLLPLISLNENENDPHGPDMAYLQDQFQALHNDRDPDYITRAPGRVNIIGEHIDYNGFGVLPMALKQSVFVAAAVINNNKGDNNTLIQLDINSTSPQAEPRQYTYPVDQLLPNSQSSSAPFDASQKDWSHYVLCAFFGVLEGLLLKHHDSNDNPWRNILRGKRFLLLIHGTVPQGAGVSSSSALVVSSTLAVLALIHSLQQQKQQPSIPNGSTPAAALPLSRPEIAHLCARCERWVGTEGGGMDQAISLFAQAGTGQYIQFQPTFQHRAISLPHNGSWVVCHSLEESHKRHDASTLFNKRVVECKIGCRLLADALDWKLYHGEGYPSSLWELVSKSGMSIIDLERIVQESIAETCSKDDLVVFVLPGKETPQTDLIQCLAAELDIVREAGIEVLEVAKSFHIRDRLLHVLSETRRVQEFVSYSSEDPTLHQRFDTTTSTPSALQSMGVIMNNSHRSCSELYNCSSVQVDKLQQICLQAKGVVGSRMTGAGWGGCVISLVDTEYVESFCRHIRRHYYTTLPVHLISKKTESDYMFVTLPFPGSQVFSVRKGEPTR